MEASEWNAFAGKEPDQTRPNVDFSRHLFILRPKYVGNYESPLNFLSNDVSHESFWKKIIFCLTGVVAILKMAATEVRADFGDGHPSFSDL